VITVERIFTIAGILVLAKWRQGIVRNAETIYAPNAPVRVIRTGTVKRPRQQMKTVLWNCKEGNDGKECV
jgi:hypothetical protein